MKTIISGFFCLLFSAGLVSAATIQYTNGAKPFISIIPYTGAGFGYDGDVAPQFWPEMYNTCAGSRQSPVNIVTSNAVNRAYPELKLKGFNNKVLGSVIHNNGHTAMMSVTLESPATISGGPLNAEYELYQYHFHWGDDENSGSENQLNGKSYPMEMHMVTWNTKYDSFATAASQSDGLAVMGFFFEISSKENTAFNFVASLASITQAESSAEFMAHPKLKELLSSDMEHYFTLLGSLTTPPCSEVVTWLNFKKPIKISSAQLKKFRSLQNDDGHEIHHNYRPPQPLNQRVVYYNTGSFFN